MSDELSLKFQAGRLRAVSKASYLSAAIWQMHPVKTEAVPTMGVDKYWRLYYNPKMVEEWSVDTLATVFIHEVWHLLRDHSTRAEIMGIDSNDRSFETMYKHQVWNYAADCEINDDLIEEQMEFPLTPVTPDAFNLPNHGMTEFYYDKIFNEKEMENAKKELESLRNKIAKKLGDHPSCVSGDDGSGAGGVTKEWELGADSKNEEGNPIPATGEGEGELIRQQVAHDIEKNIGKAPGYAERWANEKLHPKIDWRQQLRSSIRGALATNAGRSNYSYHRPSRRQSAIPNIVLPTMRSPKPDVSIVIDTSGSMNSEDLDRALGETQGVIKAIESSVEVIACDSYAYSAQRVFTKKEINLLGGGGTDMNAGLLEAAKSKPCVAIVFTDGYTPDWMPSKPKEIDTVIICIIEQKGGYNGQITPLPKWATKINVEVS